MDIPASGHVDHRLAVHRRVAKDVKAPVAVIEWTGAAAHGVITVAAVQPVGAPSPVMLAL